MTKYKVVIEPDMHKAAKFIVAIRRENDELVGIPVRGVVKKDAERMQQAIGFAFDYGLRETRSHVSDALFRMVFFVEAEQPGAELTNVQ